MLTERLGVRMTAADRELLDALVRERRKATGEDWNESKLIRELIKAEFAKGKPKRRRKR